MSPKHCLLPLAAAMLAIVPTVSQAQPVVRSQEYYELRTYRVNSEEKQSIVADYLNNALVPALHRQGLRRIGAFKSMIEKPEPAEEGKPQKPPKISVHLLVPFASLEQFAATNGKLEADKTYQEAAASFFAMSRKDSPYSRMETHLMRAFKGMPVIEMPAASKEKKARLFELRTYESHNTDQARLKVEMFNEGEIDLMRDVKLGPVFFGETLIGPNTPNLTYMLSATDEASHKEHWKGFLAAPEWDRMKKIKRYQKSVSKIHKTVMVPLKSSDI